MLNVDYKLCTRTLAGRLLKVVQFVVAPDQTCGVPGRFIGENVAFLRDVVSYASDTNYPVAILSLDQEKALTELTGPFYSPLSPKWVLVLVSANGLNCFTLTYAVL